jgi:hypothetical protein
MKKIAVLVMVLLLNPSNGMINLSCGSSASRGRRSTSTRSRG